MSIDHLMRFSNHNLDDYREDLSKVEVRVLKNGQKGVFAITDIQEGELIFIENNTISWHLSFKNADALSDLKRGEPVTLTAKLLSQPELYQSILDTGVRVEPKNWKPAADDKKHLQALAKTMKIPYYKVMEVWSVVCLYNVRGLIHTPNSQPLPTIHLGYVTNFVNHSCDPNAQTWTTTLANGDHIDVTPFKALKDIHAGDEITYAYVLNDQLDANIEVRRKAIYKANRFICQCARCVEEAG